MINEKYNQIIQELQYKERTSKERKKKEEEARKAKENSKQHIAENLYYSAFIQSEGMLVEYTSERLNYKDPIKEYLVFENYEIIHNQLNQKGRKINSLERELKRNCQERLRDFKDFNSDIIDKHLLNKK
ncbi:MAG: hypothetical protein PF542_04120 [Nanoarchaeota archaeon]|jgi:hypothetical protein|nr:hypothetical protein [Nanoarchaeota archaeon]